MPDKTYSTPVCTIDAVLFRIVNSALQVALIRRPEDARVYANTLALPGGFVHTNSDQTLDDTLLRNLNKKVGLHPAYIAKLEFEGNHCRDPEGWSITCPYLCLVDDLTPSLPHVIWQPVKLFTEERAGVSLPFDHQHLIQKAFQRLYHRAKYSTEPNYFFTSPFTLSELQGVYEIVLGKSLHKKNFRDRIEESMSVEETGQSKIVKRSRAKLYTHTHPRKPHFFSRVLQGAYD